MIKRVSVWAARGVDDGIAGTLSINQQPAVVEDNGRSPVRICFALQKVQWQWRDKSRSGCSKTQVRCRA